MGFGSLIRNADGGLNINAIKNSLKNVDFVKSLDVTDLTDIIKAIDGKTMATAFKSIDADNLANIVKNLDADKIADVAKNLDADKLNTLFKQLDKAQVTDITKKLTPNELADVLKKIDTSDVNLIKKFDDVDADKLDLAFEIMDPADLNKWSRGLADNQIIGAADDFALQNADELKNLRSIVPDLPPPSRGKKAKQFFSDQVDKLKNNKALNDFVDKSSTALKKITDNPKIRSSLKKLGLYGVIGVVVCMLIYDEPNPFKAIEKGLEDIQETAEAMKEIIDAAAGAAENAAKGGFDFLAWLFKYWYVPGILCFLLFAIYVLT